MLKTTPGIIRSSNGTEEPGLNEIFVPTLLNGRCARRPDFTPFHLLIKRADKEAVREWVRQHRPDLLAKVI